MDHLQGFLNHVVLHIVLSFLLFSRYFMILEREGGEKEEEKKKKEREKRRDSF